MTKEEQNQLVDLLKKLKPGYLPYEIFEQIARLTVLSIIEFVPLRFNDKGIIEVLLLERGKNDPIWPGKVHTPGTVIRPGDNNKNQYMAFARILEDELGGTKASSPQFAGSILHKSLRGHEHAQVYWLEVKGEAKRGQWYDASNLPINIVESQLKFIGMAVESYRKAMKLGISPRKEAS